MRLWTAHALLCQGQGRGIDGRLKNMAFKTRRLSVRAGQQKAGPLSRCKYASIMPFVRASSLGHVIIIDQHSGWWRLPVGPAGRSTRVNGSGTPASYRRFSSGGGRATQQLRSGVCLTVSWANLRRHVPIKYSSALSCNASDRPS